MWWLTLNKTRQIKKRKTQANVYMHVNALLKILSQIKC